MIAIDANFRSIGPRAADAGSARSFRLSPYTIVRFVPFRRTRNPSFNRTWPHSSPDLGSVLAVAFLYVSVPRYTLSGQDEEMSLSVKLAVDHAADTTGV
jgi:hypothetical protein